MYAYWMEDQDGLCTYISLFLRFIGRYVLGCQKVHNVRYPVVSIAEMAIGVLYVSRGCIFNMEIQG